MKYLSECSLYKIPTIKVQSFHWKGQKSEIVKKLKKIAIDQRVSALNISPRLDNQINSKFVLSLFLSFISSSGIEI